MKRARPESTACDNPPSIAPDALLALLTDADTAAGQSLANACRVSAVTADMSTRNSDAVKKALACLSTARAKFGSCTRCVRVHAQHRARTVAKKVAAALETTLVSSKQLSACAHVVNSFRHSAQHFSGFDGATTMSSALALLAESSMVVTPVVSATIRNKAFAHALGRVTLGDGLHVLRTAGTGLEFVHSNSRGMFLISFTSDTGAPIWITQSDICFTAEPANRRVNNHAIIMYPEKENCVIMECHLVRVGSLAGEGELISDVESRDVVLQLAVCGVPVPVSPLGEPWLARVPRTEAPRHPCAAGDTFAYSFETNSADSLGMDVSADEQWLVVGSTRDSTISVYSLPGGGLIRTFGGWGRSRCQFNGLCRLCFTPEGNVLVVDQGNRRLQEISLEGKFIRYMGAKRFEDGESPYCVAVHDSVVAVGCFKGIYNCTGPRVVLLSYFAGYPIQRFGEVLPRPQDSLSIAVPAPALQHRTCCGIRFTPDGQHVVAAEQETGCLYVFTMSGVLVRRVGEGVLEPPGDIDVWITATGEYVVADCANDLVCVFDAGGEGVIRSWGFDGPPELQMQHPVAVAAAGTHLYVLEKETGRVQVFV